MPRARIASGETCCRISRCCHSTAMKFRTGASPSVQRKLARKRLVCASAEQLRQQVVVELSPSLVMQLLVSTDDFLHVECGLHRQLLHSVDQSESCRVTIILLPTKSPAIEAILFLMNEVKRYFLKHLCPCPNRSKLN